MTPLEAHKSHIKNVLVSRYELNRKCEESSKLRDKVLEACTNDFRFFHDNFVFVFNPKAPKGFRKIPAVLADFQIETIQMLNISIQKKLDLLIEKSREMRVTWTFMILFLWMIMFQKEVTILVGSRKQDLVDKAGKDDTLFSKADYVFRFLPDWMKEYTDMNSVHLLRENKKMDSKIIGESANDDFGRGGRYTLSFLDEFAFWDHGDAAWSSVSESTDTRIAVSTPNGKSNKFYRIREEAKTPVFTLHWRKDPEKDDDWYELKKSKYTDEEVAQELDIDYQKSQKGLVYRGWFDFVTFGKYLYNPDLPLYVSWDFGEGGEDDTSLIWWQKDMRTNFLYMIDCYKKNFKDIRYFSPFITGFIRSERVYEYSEYEVEIVERHKGWKGAIHFGDPYNGNKIMNNTTIAKELAQDGIYLNFKRNTRVEDRITKARLAMKRIHVGEYAMEASDAISQSRYPEVKENSQSTSEKTKPVHDWTSHYRTSFEYFIDNEPEAEIKKREVIIARK